MVNVIGRGTEGIREFIRKCTAVGGVPIFRTKYGGKRFPNNGIIAACWGAGDKVKGGMITDVPPDLIEEMEKRSGDWKWLRERLGV